MSDESIPRTTKGDQLFKVDVDWWHNACLNFLYDQLDLYADGYKRAADLLVEHIKDTRSEQDTLVYPIVFLYRQYIELRLKNLIKDGNQLLDIPEEFPKHHKIDKLWKQCRRIMEKVWTEDLSVELDMVEEYIDQFSEKDPTSTAFRYPTDKDDNPSHSNLRYINLRNLSEVMAKLASLLDGANMGISVYLDHKQEYKNSFPNE